MSSPLRNNPLSPGLAEGQACLSTARGEAGCFIRLKCYFFRTTSSQKPPSTTISPFSPPMLWFSSLLFP
jgi:hypothetical protein